MEFKNREKRKECYSARDAYFECIDKQPANSDKLACKDYLTKFEKSCGQKWTEHFIRRRDYLLFKEKVEKEGVDVIDKTKL